MKDVKISALHSDSHIFCHQYFPKEASIFPGMKVQNLEPSPSAYSFIYVYSLANLNLFVFMQLIKCLLFLMYTNTTTVHVLLKNYL